MTKTSTGHNNPKQAQVVSFPPLVGLTFAITSIFLHIFFPLNITSTSMIVMIAGIITLGCGIVLQVICLQIFKKAQTTPLFQKPTTNILQSGPYARSRNPIYIAVFLQFLGVAFLINTWWLIAALPLLYLYLRYGVIAREEQYLEQKFGEEYHSYKSNVPRWL